MSRRRNIFRNERGQTMVEFALIAPILCVVLFGILQFGALYNDYVTLTDATRVGARKAATSRNDPSPVAATEAATRNAAKGLTPAKLGVTVAATWERGQTVTVKATYPYSISLLGMVVKSGTLQSETTERIE